MTYDCLIVGAGPAGLSAALHLAWHNRKVLVLDRRSGPLFYTLSKLENVPGMPGQRGVEIMKNLRAQAEAMGAEVKKASIVKASGELGKFMLESATGETFSGTTLLLATGVARFHPTVDGDYTQCLAYAGKCNLFYCPDCEAPETDGKDTLVIATGSSAGAIGTIKHLANHATRLTLLMTSDAPFKEHHKNYLEENKIELIYGEIAAFEGKKGCLDAVLLKEGQRLEHEAYFVSSPKIPRSDLAAQLGISVRESGHAEPKSQRGDTDIPGVWIAGDLRPMTQQVAVAMGTGNIAAVHIDQFLLGH
ncbi:MAG: NAD(P)/FAD-dependent oxidoreductase [Trueperaceae bacterium]|nr:NAD(P)/FAD-dependent oxidoreductase [Trueperaceae bacterium]